MRKPAVVSRVPGLAVALALAAAAPAAGAETRPPNLVVVLADDLRGPERSVEIRNGVLKPSAGA